jgi:nicotinate-nucleotide--dimethylbenzimidazole phosphoribosyltransferase
MIYARPVPLIGDATSALERSEDPQAWASPEADRAALARIITARRDIRRFRPELVDEAALGRVLAAAHAAPSVGHCQPWRFIVVSDAEIRERAALLADRERLSQAAQLDAESARRLLDLQLEGLREAPIGVVVCCDRRTPASGVLGRATFPDTDMWSCACAIENLWLAARAEGLGVGWVTLFRPADLADLLGLPEGVVTLGWLCLGWPDERPPAPGLERAGWSRRTAIADVVFREHWPADADAPAAPRSRLRAPDQKAVVRARDEADQLLTPLGSLGLLDRLLDKICALRRPELEAGTLVLIGADHPVLRHGVSAYPASVTSEVMEAAISGDAAGAVAARSAGLRLQVVDAGVGPHPVTGAVDLRPSGARGDLVGTNAMSAADVRVLLDRGQEIGRAAGQRGVVALGEVGVGNTTVAAALAAALLGLRGDQVVGLGSGSDSAMVERKSTAITAALERVRSLLGSLVRADPADLLAALGGPEFAVLAGISVGAAIAGAPVVLDGLATSVAAALAVRIEPAVAAHLVAGQRSRELAHPPVLQLLGLEPLLDLRIRAGEGVGACLAVGLLRQGMLVRRLTARTGPAQ